WKERTEKACLESLPFTQSMLQEVLGNRGRKSGSAFDRSYQLNLGKGNPETLLNNLMFLEAAKQYRPGYSMEVREKDGVFALHN
ncbi:MAG: hypothetical protein OSB62_08060, partial [Alphaproteobacteria bacterium]|nr:hypothetical protein [Alphaproteobacteria bacterium]